MEEKEEEIKKSENSRRIKNLREKAKRHTKEFNRELKKATNTAIMAAFGFLIALVWRDVITEFVNGLFENSPINGKLFSAIGVTLICVIGIMILTKLLSEKENKEENKK